MRVRQPLIAMIATGSALFFGSYFTCAQDQQKDKAPEDVIRVFTDIVQTDVMVLDKQGHFVKGLTRGDFDLRVDGKSRPIEFFEQINTGSASEEAQLAAARGMQSPADASSVDLDNGRTVLFYIDDLHLLPADLVFLRKDLSRFIDDEMGQNDEVVITSASGQIGFLQQLTDNQAVLHAAIDRLKSIPYSVRDTGHPPMTEYHALLIDRRPSTISTANMPIPDVFEYFIRQEMQETQSPREQAELAVRNRARMILQQGQAITRNTVAGLKSLVQTSSELPGRKLVFFVSGGFFYDDRNADTKAELERISADAARYGVVIYSLDPRGLTTGAPQPGDAIANDPSGVLDRESKNELWASREPMTTLALGTGGRTIFDTNAPEERLHQALTETSAYYILAWRSDHDDAAQRKAHHVDITLKNARDGTVRWRQNSYDPTETARARPASGKPPPATAASKLAAAITRIFPSRELPVAVELQYSANGTRESLLTINVEVKIDALSFSAASGKDQAEVELAGFVYNAQGKVGSNFQEHVSVTPVATEPREGGQGVFYRHRVALAPGLYQVRVGARDQQSGKIGIANEWIEIPDLATHKLTVSTIALRQTMATNATAPSSPLVNHVFHRDAGLRFDGHIFNATLADSKSDVAVQLQVRRNRQPVLSTPLQRIPDNPSSSALGFGGTLSLQHLPVGRYLLFVTVIDRLSKTSASQQTRFEIH